jgi:hypothetical protein
MHRSEDDAEFEDDFSNDPALHDNALAEAERIVSEAAALVTVHVEEVHRLLQASLDRAGIKFRSTSDRIVMRFAAGGENIPGFRIHCRIFAVDDKVAVLDLRADRDLQPASSGHVDLLSFVNTWNQGHRWPTAVVSTRRAADHADGESLPQEDRIVAKQSLLVNLDAATVTERTVLGFLRNVQDLFTRATATGH